MICPERARQRKQVFFQRNVAGRGTRIWLMLNFIRQLFRDQPVLDTEIPRYPPFAKGLPSVREERLLVTQQELIDKLRQSLPFDRKQFDELMLPVIKRYAAFVHLLPASETHHHRGAGGLLHHGLEVAHIAARSSEDVMFAANAEPKRRRELEPRWRMAVCLAGLTHDIGKPISDLSVTDSTGGRTWNAYTENLAEWTQRESVDRYFLHWHKGRHRRHEQFSVLVMERVLTRECMNWLAQYGPEIPHALLNSVAMADIDNNDIGPLIKRADNTSVERDMKRYQSSPNESLGVPVERYIIDAMRRLISQGKWQVNEKGSRVWLLTDGLHVVWPAAAHEITRVLQRDGVAGVPRDPDSIADILIDRGLATPRETESTTYRYWPMRPASFEDADPNRLMMMRLADPYLLFSEPPPAMKAEVIETRPKPNATSDQDSAATKDKQPKAVVKKHRSEPILAPDPAQSNPAPVAPAAAPAPIDCDSPDDQLAAAIPHLQDDDEDTFTVDDPQSVPESAPSDTQSEEDQHAAEQPKPAGKRRRTRKIKAEADSRPLVTSVDIPSPAIDFEAGQAETILQALHTKGEWETHLFKRRDLVLVTYPDGAGLAGSPTDVQRILADEGLIKTDPLSPMLKVQTIDGVKGLLLAPRISALLLGSQTAVSAKVAKPADKAPTQAANSEQQGTESPTQAPDSAQRQEKTAQQPGKQAVTTESRNPEADQSPSQASGQATPAKARNGSKPKSKSAKHQQGETMPAADEKQRPSNSATPAAGDSQGDTKSGSDSTPGDLARGLIDAIRDADQKIPCQRDHQDGWIYVSQVVIKWFASSRAKTSAAQVRAAAASHPDIVLDAKTRIGVKEQSNA